MSEKRECLCCGRRHGERVRMGLLEPVRFGGAARWVWLDETPPAAFRAAGAIWRTSHGNRLLPGVEPSGPFTWDRPTLTQFTPTEMWAAAYDAEEPVYGCDLCRDYTDEMVAEGDFTAERLPEPSGERPVLLEVAA